MSSYSLIYYTLNINKNNNKKNKNINIFSCYKILSCSPFFAWTRGGRSKTKSRTTTTTTGGSPSGADINVGMAPSSSLRIQSPLDGLIFNSLGSCLNGDDTKLVNTPGVYPNPVTPLPPFDSSLPELTRTSSWGQEYELMWKLYEERDWLINYENR